MRVQRFKSADTSIKSAGVRKQGKAESAESQDQDSAVEDDLPEDSGSADFESVDSRADPDLFPGISEGLTREYLQHQPRGGLDLQRDLSVSRQTVLACSDVSHTFRRLNDCLEPHPRGYALRELLEHISTCDKLLALFVAQEHLEGRQSLIDKLAQASPLPLASFEYSGLESLFWGGQPNLYTTYSEFSQSYFGHKYVCRLAFQTQLLFRTFLPQLGRDVPLRLRVRQAEQNNAGYEWVEGEHRLTLLVSEALGEIRNQWASLPTNGSFGGDNIYRRGVSDLVSVVHEYAHAVYDRIQGKPASADLGKVNRALSEGFAILCELVLLDCLITHCNVTCPDQEQFRRRRTERIEWLQSALQCEVSSAHLAYAEGTELITSLFAEGGMAKVLEFVAQVNPGKANSLARSHPDYSSAPTDSDRVLALIGKHS